MMNILGIDSSVHPLYHRTYQIHPEPLCTGGWRFKRGQDPSGSQ